VQTTLGGTATEIALSFLAQVITLERLEAAEKGIFAPGPIEARIALVLAAAAGLDYQPRPGDRERLEKIRAEASAVVARSADAMIRSATSEYQIAQKETRFRGLHTALAGHLRPSKVDEFFNQDAAKPFRRLRGTKGYAFKTKTELRAIIARELDISEREVRRLEKRTGLGVPGLK
jgi:hypothetical protein